jgi:hypothetical protein
MVTQFLDMAKVVRPDVRHPRRTSAIGRGAKGAYRCPYGLSCRNAPSWMSMTTATLVGLAGWGGDIRDSGFERHGDLLGGVVEPTRRARRASMLVARQYKQGGCLLDAFSSKCGLSDKNVRWVKFRATTDDGIGRSEPYCD